MTPKAEKTEGKSKEQYWEGIGRRKTSTARVRVWEAGKASFNVNGMDGKVYFKTEEERRLIQDPFVKGISAAPTGSKWAVEARVSGGGHHSQAEAVRHGLARALVIFDGELRKKMKALHFLMRDPRAKERRKFGFEEGEKGTSMVQTIK